MKVWNKKDFIYKPKLWFSLPIANQVLAFIETSYSSSSSLSSSFARFFLLLFVLRSDKIPNHISLKMHRIPIWLQSKECKTPKQPSYAECLKVALLRENRQIDENKRPSNERARCKLQTIALREQTKPRNKIRPKANQKKKICSVKCRSRSVKIYQLMIIGKAHTVFNMLFNRLI